MGLDFSYILYFQWEKIWDALDAVVKIAQPSETPSRLVFPDHELLIPMDTWSSNNGLQHADDPELDYSTVLYFEEDEAILEYMESHGKGMEDLRCPPESTGKRKYAIGYVYLSIYNRKSDWYGEEGARDVAAFDFGTPGTTMSILFQESTSIRNTFLNLARSVPAVCAVFNNEFDGEVIWWKGKEVSFQIGDPFMQPHEIENFLSSPKPPVSHDWTD